MRARPRHYSRRCSLRAATGVERTRAGAACASDGYLAGGRMTNNTNRRNIALGPGREFDIVRTLLDEWGRAAERIGDDAAILEVPPGERVVVTTDTSVEDVHFKREWLNHFEIGYRATVASLSDLAAMGARPLGIVVALTLPEGAELGTREVGTGISKGASAILCPVRDG